MNNNHARIIKVQGDQLLVQLVPIFDDLPFNEESSSYSLKFSTVINKKYKSISTGYRSLSAAEKALQLISYEWACVIVEELKVR